MKVVISQSMYFPWVGFLEQLRLTDAYVIYDDVQFSKGSFTNRVQIKTSAGPRWLSAPLSELRLGTRISEVRLDCRRDWRRQHRDQLAQAYRRAPYLAEMLSLVDSVFSAPTESLSELSYLSTMALANYFDINDKLHSCNVADLGVDGNGSERVLSVVKRLGGTTYITGHGAKNYLDHSAFEKEGIDVHYMNYDRSPYPQDYGEFNPYVSALDLVANCGQQGRKYIKSAAINWKDFINEQT